MLKRIFGTLFAGQGGGSAQNAHQESVPPVESGIDFEVDPDFDPEACVIIPVSGSDSAGVRNSSGSGADDVGLKKVCISADEAEALRKEAGIPEDLDFN